MTSRWAERKDSAVALKDEATDRFAEARRRWPWLHQPIATYERYLDIRGNAQAAAATYYGFLSFYPILAIAFFVVGKLATYFPEADDNLVTALETFLPGVFGDGPGQIPLSTFTDNATTVGIIGLIGAVYAGLGWLSGVRNALAVTFDQTKEERFNFFIGKLRDLLTLAVLGVTLLLSVGLSGIISTLSSEALADLNLDGPGSRIYLEALAHLLAVAATMLLFLLMYVLLTRARLTWRAKLYGALVGALLFEVLKVAAFWVLGAVRSQEAFALLGISLVLLVWINYFSRILVFSGCWTFMTDHRDDEALQSLGEPETMTG